MKVAEQFLAYVQEFCQKQRGGQKELVRISKVSQPTVSRMVKGDTSIGIKAMSAVSDALGLTLVKASGDTCPEKDERLKAALKRIAELEVELSAARGELKGIQRAFDFAMAQARIQTPAITQEKSYGLPDSKSEENVG